MRILRLAALAILVSSAAAHAAQGPNPHGKVKATLRAFDEVPALSNPGTNGTLTGNVTNTSFTYTLTYPAVGADVTQAHFHLAQPNVNGGIVVFICTNLGNGPVGTPSCPVGGGTVSDTVNAEDVVGAAAQGLTANEINEFLAAVRAGTIYVNVHSTAFPGGAIRGQLAFTPKK